MLSRIYLITKKHEFHSFVYLKRLFITIIMILFRLTVQDMSQAGNIPIRIENLPSHLKTTEQAPMDNVLTVQEGMPIELPCVGIGLPPPIYRYVGKARISKS